MTAVAEVSVTAARRERLPLFERTLRFTAIAYLASIPLDAQALLPGRSWSSIFGSLMIASWLLNALLSRTGTPSSQRTAVALYASIAAFLVWILLKYPFAWEPELGLEPATTFIAVSLSVLALRRAFTDGRRTPIIAVIVGTSSLSLLLIMQALVLSATATDYRATSLDLNQNQAAVIIAVGLLFTCLLLLELASKQRLLALMLVVLQAAGVLTTGSRTGFLVLILAALLVPVLAATQPGQRLSRFTLSTILVAVVGALMWSLRGFLPGRLSNALEALAVGDFTGREEIWQATLFYQDQWWPWGAGLGNDVLVTGGAYGASVDSHNTFLWSAVELGLLGLLCVILIFAATLFAARLSPYKTYVWAGMVPILAFSLSTTLFHFKILWVLIALAAVRVPVEQRSTPRTSTPNGLKLGR